MRRKSTLGQLHDDAKRTQGDDESAPVRQRGFSTFLARRGHSLVAAKDAAAESGGGLKRGGSSVMGGSMRKESMSGSMGGAYKSRRRSMGHIDDEAVHGDGRPLPIQYVVSNLSLRVNKDRLYSDMIIYFPFLALFMVFFLAGRNIEVNHMAASSIRDMFMLQLYADSPTNELTAIQTPRDELPQIALDQNYRQIAHANHYYQWIEDVLVPYTWDCENPGYSRQTLFHRGQLEYIGAMKFRIMVMRNDSCALNGAYKVKSNRSTLGFFTELEEGKPQACYSKHDRDGEQKRTVCHQENPARIGEIMWKYQEPSEAQGSWSTTGVNGIYHEGGYVANLPFNATCNQIRQFFRIMHSSKDCDLLRDDATRFAIFEWFHYATNTDTYLTAKMFVEVMKGGAWIPSWQFRMFPVWTEKRLVLSIFDIFFFIFVLYFVVALLQEWIIFYRENKKILAFCFDIWNLLELTNLATFFAVFILRCMWWAESRASKIQFPFNSNYPTDLDRLVILFSMQIYANSFNVVITMLKILKFLRLNNRMNVLSRTFGVCQQSIIGVLCLFVFVVLGYAICGTSLYGANLLRFRNINTSFSGLMFMLLGQFDYIAMRQIEPTLTGFYYFSYIVLANFLLLNFIIAILSEGFSQVSAETALEPLDQAILRAISGLKYSLHPRNLKKLLELRLKRKTRAELLSLMQKYLEEHIQLILETEPELLDQDLPLHKADLQHWLPEQIYSDLGAFYVDILWEDMEHDYEIDAHAADYQERKEIERSVQAGAHVALGETIDKTFQWDYILQGIENKVGEIVASSHKNRYGSHYSGGPSHEGSFAGGRSGTFASGRSGTMKGALRRKGTKKGTHVNLFPEESDHM